MVNNEKIKEYMTAVLKSAGYDDISEVTSHVFNENGEVVDHQMLFKTEDDEDDMIVNFKTKEVDGITKISDIQIF